QFLHYFPVVRLVLGVLSLLGGCGDQRDHIVAQVTGGPDGTELLVHEVGATARVRDLGGLHQSRELAGLGVHGRDLVGRVGGDQEVAMRGIPAAVMQELGGFDGGGLEVLDVGVV